MKAGGKTFAPNKEQPWGEKKGFLGSGVNCRKTNKTRLRHGTGLVS